MLDVKALEIGAPPDRSARMHARGHAYYRTSCPDGCCLAARWAARRLITPRGFLTACRAAGDWDGIAGLLGVTTDDVCAYLAALTPAEWLLMMKLVGRDLRDKA